MRGHLIRPFGAMFAVSMLSSAIGLGQLASAQGPAGGSMASENTASQSLGDIARENQKSKPSQESGAKVITNADLTSEPYGVSSIRNSKSVSSLANPNPTAKPNRQPVPDPRVAQRYKKQISQQRNAVANTLAQIAELRARMSTVDPAFATHSAGSNYASMTYNPTLTGALARLRSLELKLIQQKQALDETQELARHDGMHTSIYDP